MLFIDHCPQPIPEGLKPVRNLLLGQLALARAPYSGRQTACVLLTAQEEYGGHVVERAPDDIQDPFLMALAAVPSASTKIEGIVVTGEGPIKRKHVMPSAKAYSTLKPLLTPDAPILVIEPNSWDSGSLIQAPVHRWAYAPKEVSVFRGKTVFESQTEAIRNTLLDPEDCAFIAHLRQSGLNTGIHYYLTGSGSGQGGPSYAITPYGYNDMDIIAVSHTGKEQTEAAFEKLATTWYAGLEKEAKRVEVLASGKVLEASRYFNADGVSIDFFVAPTLEEAFVYPEYFANNLFHKLS